MSAQQLYAAAWEFWQREARRQMTSKAAIDQQAASPIGLAPDDWLMLTEYLHNRGYDLDAAADAGLVIRREDGRGYYDRYRGVFVVAQIENGAIMGFTSLPIPT